jgi:ribose/xylose/arabinose/galactoside ABC-type transport system permease subunit
MIFHRVGVVFAFFSNEQTFRSLENFQESVNEVADTGVNYINDTIRVSHNSCDITVSAMASLAHFYISIAFHKININGFMSYTAVKQLSVLL